MLVAKRHIVRQIVTEQSNERTRDGASSARCCETSSTPQQLTLFDRPRLIIAFRDPVSIAMRTSLSEYRHPMRTLLDTMTRQAELLDFLDQVTCSTCC